MYIKEETSSSEMSDSYLNDPERIANINLLDNSNETGEYTSNQLDSYTLPSFGSQIVKQVHKLQDEVKLKNRLKHSQNIGSPKRSSINATSSEDRPITE